METEVSVVGPQLRSGQKLRWRERTLPRTSTWTRGLSAPCLQPRLLKLMPGVEPSDQAHTQSCRLAHPSAVMAYSCPGNSLTPTAHCLLASCPTF